MGRILVDARRKKSWSPLFSKRLRHGGNRWFHVDAHEISVPVDAEAIRFRTDGGDILLAVGEPVIYSGEAPKMSERM